MTAKRAKSYIVVAHLPACSAVLHVNGKQVTILREDTRAFCEAFAIGLAWGSGFPKLEHRGSVDLPAGNPATSYERGVLNAEVSR